MNLTDYNFVQELYSGASDAANYTITVSKPFFNATYNFPAVINSSAEYIKDNAFNLKAYLDQQATLAMESATSVEFLSESNKANIAAAAEKASELKTKAYKAVTQDAPEALHESASNAANSVYATGSYIRDSIVYARDTVANQAQEIVDTAYTTAQSIAEQCNANEICANTMDAAPYVAAGVAALAAAGVAYKLYGYMQDKESQSTLIDIATPAEPEVVKHECKNHDHNHAEVIEIPSSLKNTLAHN